MLQHYSEARDVDAALRIVREKHLALSGGKTSYLAVVDVPGEGARLIHGLDALAVATYAQVTYPHGELVGVFDVETIQ